MADAFVKKGYKVISGGTDNHLMLVDLRPWNLTGVEAEERLAKVGITVNKNMIPYDDKKPTITSGIRIGTAAVTSRGFREKDIEEIASIIGNILREKDKADLEPYKEAVISLCLKHPLYMTPHEISASLTRITNG